MKMSKTILTIDGELFKINGKLTYSEIEGTKPKMHGLLMNSRHIQGIFDTQKDAERFNRYGQTFDPQKNTDDMIKELPSWYAKGMRAITVGMQGGGNCFTIAGRDLYNNPYSPDGKTVNPDYLNRLDKVITACDEMGMIVIVSYFYSENLHELDGAQAIINVVKTMGTFLKEKGYTNVIIEIANEQNIRPFKTSPIIYEPQGMVALLDIAKDYSGNIPVGCSGGGGFASEEICKASDIILIHGNGESRTQLYNHIRRVRGYSPNKPVVINEDSQAIGQIKVCEELATSWGYYNNMTKQEVPTYWEITKGEDEYFAWRMADMIGIPQEEIPFSEQYYFQGLEPHMHHNGIRFPRVASLYPETIDFVRFYQNGDLYYVCYDESFTVNFNCNWRQGGVETKDGDVWEAEIVLVSGEIIKFKETVKNT